MGRMIIPDKLGKMLNLLGLVVGYPVFLEPHLIQVNTYRIPLPRLPAPFVGFRIAQLTDLHYGFFLPDRFLRQVIRRVNSLEPDMIACTGDFVHARGEIETIDAVWAHLKRLRAASGVWAVLGNHDHYLSFGRSLNRMIQSGMNLRHRSIPIKKGNHRIWIGGAGDHQTDAERVDQTFDGVPPEACKILLAHNPDTADTPFRTSIDLVISGHTHGGQVRVPFIAPPKMPVQHGRYISGLMQARRTRLFISRGIGWAGLPIRFNCFPEIAVLELLQGNDGGADGGH